MVHGGVTEFFGQVMTIIPEKSACLNCLIPEIDSNTYLVKGVISPAVSTIASIESMEVIKIILNIENLLTDKLLTFDGIRQEFKKINIAKNPDCPACQPIPVKKNFD